MSQSFSNRHFQSLIKCFRFCITLFCFICSSFPVLSEIVISQEIENQLQDGKLIKVTGLVLEENGHPIPGVNIIIKGTTRGTITNIDGKFSIDVQKSAILRFSFIGMKPVERTVQEKMKIVLAANVSELDEIIAVGYGTQKKGDMITAVATMNAEKLNDRSISTLDQGLIGQMAGVHVKQTSGMPGEALSIQVRGTGSISANNEPLYVIDGFAIEPSEQSSDGSYSDGSAMDNINPNDIESIQVLKDASAAAIYGSRGANGVVIITTKSGRKGRPRLTFSTSLGISRAQRKLDVLTPQEWIDNARDYIDYNYLNKYQSSGATRYDDDATRREILGKSSDSDYVNASYMYDPNWYVEGYPGLILVDWQDQLLQTGFTQTYQLGARGGTNTAMYYISADYMDQQGVVKEVNYKRYSARANVELNPQKFLKISLNVSPSYSITDDPGVEGKGGIMQVAVQATPIVDASIGLNNVNIGDYKNDRYSWANSNPSPIRLAEDKTQTKERFRLITSTSAELSLINRFLTFKTSLNFDYQTYKLQRFSPSYFQSDGMADGRESGYTRTNMSNENTLHYRKTFKKKHKVDILLGHSYSKFHIERYQIDGTDYANDEIQTINQAVTTSGTTTASENVLISYFGRFQYNLNRKYLLQASIRRDGSSKFGSDQKWGFFPAASLGWKIKNESFMSVYKWMSELKLRVSWGETGNNGIGDYGHLASVSSGNYSYGGSLENGVYPSGLSNTELSWETSTTTDFGVDFGFLSNRITGSFDWYHKVNSDLLLDVPVPAETGTTEALSNIGQVENNGWELELTTRNIVGKFEWSTSLNLSRNKNKVQKLGSSGEMISLSSSYGPSYKVLAIGEEINTFYLLKQNGLLTTADIENSYPIISGETAGDPKYIDINEDGEIDSDDRTFCGSAAPDITWGLRNNFSWKGFDLSVFIQGQRGGQIYSLLGRALYLPGMGFKNNTLGRANNRVDYMPGDILTEADVKGKERKSNTNYTNIFNTEWLYSSDYWRVRNLTIGYNLKHVVKIQGISNARIYCTLENFFGGDKYSGGWNPEAVNSSGDDYGSAPLTKSCVLGLNLTF